MLADPVRQMKLELRLGTWRECSGECNVTRRVCAQAIERERQYLGTHRVADEEHALLVPRLEVVADHALEVGARFLGSARLPEILQRRQAHGGNTARGQVRGESSIKARPTAIARQDHR